MPGAREGAALPPEELQAGSPELAIGFARRVVSCCMVKVKRRRSAREIERTRGDILKRGEAMDDGWLISKVRLWEEIVA